MHTRLNVRRATRRNWPRAPHEPRTCARGILVPAAKACEYGMAEEMRRRFAPTFVSLLCGSALLLLSACGGSSDATEPLSGVYVFELFYGRFMEATTADGKRYYFYFDRRNFAQRVGATAGYVRWYTDATQGLCLQEYGSSVVCGPVYQLNVQHFRWRDVTFSDLSPHQPAFGAPHGIPGGRY
jgi:hypothetical protein